ncbi:MAG: ABC transporter ATP-binding protein [Paracoccaceae bacterium]|nr:ABC transporter ATP-binding protein [Paracoccaceae bacterium]
MSAPLLSVAGLSVGYGGGDIVRNVGLHVAAGQIATIVGPNGAGKSTLLKAIAGVLHPREGEIRVGQTPIGGLPASEVSRHGVSYVPQEANVFRQLTVRENLEIGAWVDPAGFAERLAGVHAMFPVLAEKSRVRAGNLSGGQRQMVAFGMALMVRPRVLLLDEPSAGLSPALVAQMFETVKAVNKTGIAVLMVEQNAIQALQISDFGYVMAAGRVAMADRASVLLASTSVAELYLGTRQ